MTCPNIHRSTISECINIRGYADLVPFPKDLILLLPARQSSHMDDSPFDTSPSIPSLANLGT